MEKAQVPAIRSAREIHDKKVYDAAGNECGQIASLLFDGNDSQLLFAVISLQDNFLTKGTTAIPWNSIDFNPNTGSASLRINKELLFGAPKLHLVDFKLSNRNIFYDLLKYYGYNFKQESSSNSLTHDPVAPFHHDVEGGEYTGNPHDDVERNKMGEELDFDKIKGIDRRN